MSLLPPVQKAAPLDYDKTWAILSKEVGRLVTDFSQGISHEQFVCLHTYIYKICTIPQGQLRRPLPDRLYFSLKALLEEFCTRVATDLLSSPSILSLYASRWHGYCTGMQFVDRLFDYLNRYWVRTHCSSGVTPLAGVYASIYEMGIAVWQGTVQCPAVAERVYEAIWGEALCGRRGQLADYMSVRAVLAIYLQLGSRGDESVYDADFALPFVQRTYHFYAQEAAALMASVECAGYVSEAHARISSEIAAASRYATHETLPHICRACERAFIGQQQAPLQAFFDELLTSEDRRDELWKLFSLLRRVDGTLDNGRRKFQELVATSGTEAVHAFFAEIEHEGRAQSGPANRMTSATAFLETVISKYSKYCEMVAECFEGDKGFLAAAERGFVIFINCNRQSAELFARCCHGVLDKGPASKALSEKEVDRILLLVVTALRYLLDKDIFQSHYAKLLAKRLINDSSMSQQAEEHMVQALRSTCSPDFTSRLSRMIQDKALSYDLDTQYTTERFAKMSVQRSADVLPHRVMVLTTGTWPMSAKTNETMIAPEPIQSCMDMYQGFYQTRYRGRRLTFNFDLSRADVRSYFDKAYELQVTTGQLAVMLIYNETESASLEDIIRITGQSSIDAAQCALSLVKAKLLVQQGVQPQEEGDDLLTRLCAVEGDTRRMDSVVLTLNPGFTSKRQRLKLLPPAPPPEEAKKGGVPADVVEDRKAVLQAVLVRVMKTRKEIDHLALVSEVCKQLHNRFHPTMPEIKKHIDILIDKEYMERVQDGDVPMYVYVA